MRSRGSRTLAAALVMLLGVVVGGVSVIGDAAPAHADTATTSISGTISLPAGSPAVWLQDAQVSAQSSSTDPGTSVFVNAQSGSYTISGLAPGIYRIQFNVGEYADPTTGEDAEPNLLNDYFGGTTDYAAATPVTTSVSSPATGVNFTPRLGGTITGTVQTTGAGVAFSSLFAYYVNVDDPTDPPFWGDGVDGTGAYTVTQLIPGSYKVLITNDGGSPLIQGYVGGNTYATASTITVTSGSTVAGQNVMLPAVSNSAPRPAAPTPTVSSTTAETATLAWTAPASVDPILAYWVVPNNDSSVSGDTSRLLATTSNLQRAVETYGASTLVEVTAETARAEGDTGVIVMNVPSDPAAPTLTAVDSGNDGLTVTASSGSAPSGAAFWFEYVSAGGGDVEYGNPDAGTNSYTFTGLNLSAGDTVYAGWNYNVTVGSESPQSQIATLELAPPVNAWFQAKYQQLGGASGSLGEPTAVMQCQSSSCWQQFTGGVLTSDGSEIVELSTAYVSTWLANGGPDGELGLVAGPESCFGTYCVTPFTHGVVTWTPNVGVTATVVNAWFEAKWKQLGGVTGSLGSPTAAMQCQSSSCWQQFTGGVLTSDGTQIVKLSSAYVSTWLAWGGPNGDLGLVNGSEACYGTYCQTPFAGGLIVWVPNSGVYPVAKNWFLPAWTAHGGASGSLGLPAAAMQCQSAACYQVFQNGTLTSSTTGIVALSSAYVSTWLADGGPNGSLGLVAGPEQCFSTYCQVPFQHGTLVWQPGVGVHLAS